MKLKNNTRIIDWEEGEEEEEREEEGEEEEEREEEGEEGEEEKEDGEGGGGKGDLYISVSTSIQRSLFMHFGLLLKTLHCVIILLSFVKQNMALLRLYRVF